MSRILRVGVIGVGTIGREHLKAYQSEKNVEVVAISDINKRVLSLNAEKFGIKKTFTDYHELLELSKLDAVSVCTPPFNHAAITCDAASAGKHVLCEKPMAMNSKEAEIMVRACREADVKLGIGSARLRFTPSIELARRYISEGKLGKVYYARVSRLRRRGRPGIDGLKESKWFLDSSKAGGGALIDIGCYDIDLILYLLNSPQPTSVSAITFRGVEEIPKLNVTYDVEEHSTALVRFDGNLAVTFETAWASNMRSGWKILIFGSRGGLELDPPTSLTYFTEERDEQVAINFDLTLKYIPPMTMLIKDFVSACLEDREPKTPGEDGLKVMQAITMAYRSAELGREVRLEELME